MSSVGKYLITISFSAIICSSIRNFFNNNTVQKSLIQLLTGIFMIVVIISPFIKWNPHEITDYMESMTWNHNRFTDDGTKSFQEERNLLISEKTEAYILNKASGMGADLTATVQLSNDEPPVPQAVTIKGAVSPFVKSTLGHEISSHLGISKENQTWINIP